MSIRVFIVCEKCEKSFFCKTRHSGHSLSRLEWVVSLNHETTARSDCTFCPVVLQLSWPFSFLTYFKRVAFWRVASCESLAKSRCENPLNAHTLEFLHTLSHTTLTLFLTKYRVSNCWNYKQIWYGIKPIHGWINSTLQLILRNFS